MTTVWGAQVGAAAPWGITVAGSITLDEVTTPMGHRTNVMGGSCVYFALSASCNAPVHLVATVGEDGAQKLRALLTGLDISTDGVTPSTLPTFRSHLVHDFSTWMTTSVATESGAYEGWHPHLPPEAANAEILFLGSTFPHRQKEAARQSRAKLIACDSMAVFIEEDKEAVMDVVGGSDILFADRREVTLLAGRPYDEWHEAATQLLGHGRLRAVVVKLGPHGATLITADGAHHEPAVDLGAVVDPTGAGDTFAGGFLGYLAATHSVDTQAFPAALHAALKAARYAISSFGTDDLRQWAVGAKGPRR